MTTVNNILRQLRENRNYTQADIAKILGISRQSYNNFENRYLYKLNKSRMLKIEKLSEFYGVSVEDIIKHVKKNI